MLRNARLVLLILTGLNLVNYIDRFVLAAVGPKLQAELGLTNFEFGLAINAFMLGYFLTSPVFGVLGDRFARKGLITAGIVGFSLATAASGLARRFATLVGARVWVGVGEASYATLAPTIIDDLAGASRKGRWMAIFYVAIPVGSALGFVLGGLLEHSFGWRNAFLLTGGPGLLLAALVAFIAEPPRERQRERGGTKVALGSRARARSKNDAASAGGMRGYLALAKITTYRDTVLGYAAYTFALGGFAAWAPKFLYSELEMDLKAADFWLGVVLVVTGLVATFVGAELAGRMPARSQLHANQRLCAATAIVAAPLALVTLRATSSTAFFCWIAATEFALFLSTAPINVVILGSVPEELRASAMAASIFAIHLLGDLISPPLIGALADRGSLRNAMLILPLAIVLCAYFWGRASRAFAADQPLSEPGSGPAPRQNEAQ